MFKRLFLLLAVLSSVMMPLGAQDVSDTGFYAALRGVGNTMRLLCVAARPGEADLDTLALYSLRYGVEAGVLYMTNQGAEKPPVWMPEWRNCLHLTTQKSYAPPEEILEAWRNDSAVERLVEVLRTWRPQVVVSPYPKEGATGRGDATHTLLMEAVAAAGNPVRFSKQIDRGLHTWQVSRVFQRSTEEGKVAGMVCVNPYTLIPHAGKTYAEWTGVKNLADTQLRFYRKALDMPVPVGWTGSTMEAQCGPFFEGVAHINDEQWIDLSQNTAQCEVVLPTLFEQVRRAALHRGRSPETDAAWERLNHAAVCAAQVRLEQHVSATRIAPGQEVSITARLQDFGLPEVTAATLYIAPEPGYYVPEFQQMRLRWLPEKHESEESPAQYTTATFTFTVPEHFKPNVKPGQTDHVAWCGAPQMYLVAELTCRKQNLEIRRPLFFDIAPKIEVCFLDAPYFIATQKAKPVEATVALTYHGTQPTATPLLLTAPEGWGFTSPQPTFEFTHANEQQVAVLSLTPPANLAVDRYTIGAMVPGMPAPAEALVQAWELHLPKNIRGGFLGKTDGALNAALRAIGVTHAPLTLVDFAPERLDAFSHIVVDANAYGTVSALKYNADALKDYVERGGMLLIAGQRPEYWQPEYAPYPLALTQETVRFGTLSAVPLQTVAALLFPPPMHVEINEEEETAQKTMLRGLIGMTVGRDAFRAKQHYPAVSWDDAYTPLAIADTLEGASTFAITLLARHGKGLYLYSALNWGEALQDLRPSALSLLASFFSLPVH